MHVGSPTLPRPPEARNDNVSRCFDTEPTCCDIGPRAGARHASPQRLGRDGPSTLQGQVTSGGATTSGNDVGDRPQHGGHETGRRKSGNDVGDRPRHGGERNGASRNGTTAHVGRCNEIGQRRRRPPPTRASRNGTTVHVGRCNDVGDRPQHGGNETGRHGTGRRFTSGSRVPKVSGVTAPRLSKGR